jgi:hypothetical protein
MVSSNKNASVLVGVAVWASNLNFKWNIWDKRSIAYEIFSPKLHTLVNLAHFDKTIFSKHEVM